MTDEKRIDDKDLEDVTGAGGETGLNQDLQSNPGDGPNLYKQPVSDDPPVGGGSPDPESEGGGGGIQDLEI